MAMNQPTYPVPYRLVPRGQGQVVANYDDIGELPVELFHLETQIGGFDLVTTGAPYVQNRTLDARLVQVATDTGDVVGVRVNVRASGASGGGHLIVSVPGTTFTTQVDHDTTAAESTAGIRVDLPAGTTAYRITYSTDSASIQLFNIHIYEFLAGQEQRVENLLDQDADPTITAENADHLFMHEHKTDRAKVTTTHTTGPVATYDLWAGSSTYLFIGTYDSDQAAEAGAITGLNHYYDSAKRTFRSRTYSAGPTGQGQWVDTAPPTNWRKQWNSRSTATHEVSAVNDLVAFPDAYGNVQVYRVHTLTTGQGETKTYETERLLTSEDFGGSPFETIVDVPDVTSLTAGPQYRRKLLRDQAGEGRLVYVKTELIPTPAVLRQWTDDLVIYNSGGATITFRGVFDTESNWETYAADPGNGVVNNVDIALVDPDNPELEGPSKFVWYDGSSSRDVEGDGYAHEAQAYHEYLGVVQNRQYLIDHGQLNDVVTIEQSATDDDIWQLTTLAADTPTDEFRVLSDQSLGATGGEGTGGAGQPDEGFAYLSSLAQQQYTRTNIPINSISGIPVTTALSATAWTHMRVTIAVSGNIETSTHMVIDPEGDGTFGTVQYQDNNGNRVTPTLQSNDTLELIVPRNLTYELAGGTNRRLGLAFRNATQQWSATFVQQVDLLTDADVRRTLVRPDLHTLSDLFFVSVPSPAPTFTDGSGTAVTGLSWRRRAFPRISFNDLEEISLFFRSAQLSSPDVLQNLTISREDLTALTLSNAAPPTSLHATNDFVQGVMSTGGVTAQSIQKTYVRPRGSWVRHHAGGNLNLPTLLIVPRTVLDLSTGGLWIWALEFSCINAHYTIESIVSRHTISEHDAHIVAPLEGS